MKYLDRKAHEILRPAQEACVSLGLVCSEVDENMYANEVGDRGAGFIVYADATEDRILMDCRVEIQSATGYGEEGGWAFGLASTEYGGGIGPGGTICNYTDRVWTVDRDEIRARLDALDLQSLDWAERVAEYARELITEGK